MEESMVLELFKKTGALLDGHFIYASGRHGKQFLQAARVLQFPQYTEQLCKAIAEYWSSESIDLVCGPATGGIILSYETARHLGCRSVFSEKNNNGEMVVRRGFGMKPGLRVLVVEDIITTGGSVKKTISHLLERGLEIAGVSVLIDRSGGEASFEYPYKPLASLPMESWEPERCRLCQDGIELVDPDELEVSQI